MGAVFVVALGLLAAVGMLWMLVHTARRVFEPLPWAAASRSVYDREE